MSKLILERRSMPQTLERRNQALEEMEGLIKQAKVESRGLSISEQTKFNNLKKEVDSLDVKLAENQLKHGEFDMRGFKSEKQKSEERAFLDYIVKGDMRALSASASGGAVIPTEISSRIVDKIVNMSPILQRATIFNTNADLSVPVMDFTSITAGYITEGSSLVDAGADFTSIKLTNKIIASLTKFSRSLVNRSDIDVTSYLATAIAKNIARYLENELIMGSGGTRLSGLITTPTAQRYTGATVGVLAPDELIDMQMRLPQVYQDNAIWILNPTTLATIRKFKSTQNEYLFNEGAFNQDMGMQLLGKPVFVSDAMPLATTTGAMGIFYLDPACLYVKMTQQVGVQLLDQTFANSYQYGILGYVELDSAICEQQGCIAYVGK